MASKFSAYRRLLKLLKQKCPPGYPVSVRRAAICKKLEGRCWKHGKKFFIQIDKALDEHRAIDVLLHEWAHARAWNCLLDGATDDESFNKLAHDASWGVAYAAAYAVYEQNLPQTVL
ncbi:hypothetical protein EBZ39_01330 [bacterium]|nr:hypothetical protein [bacterium]